MTDKAGVYTKLGLEFAVHHSVSHCTGEYVSKTNLLLHTQTVENFFSVFKLGVHGTYQHCEHDHLGRYLSEFEFRYNNRVKLGICDGERAERLLMAVAGKRLTYQRTN